MRKKSLLHHLVIGLLVGIFIMPPSIVHAQWTVFDPSQYALQVTKKVEEANRWIQHYTNLVQQLTSTLAAKVRDYGRDLCITKNC
jgi:hypothetical protein